jgi:DNA-binding NtrC family response regulator
VLLLGEAQIPKELRGGEASLSEASLAAIRAHNWPRNVRELENAIERACILSDSMVLEPKDLGLAAASSAPETLNVLDLSGSLLGVANRACDSRKIAEALMPMKATSRALPKRQE